MFVIPGETTFWGYGANAISHVQMDANGLTIIFLGGTQQTGNLNSEIFNVPWFTATQREVAPDKLARVSSVDFLVSYGLMPIGLATYPWLVTEFGRTPVLLVTVALCALTPLFAAFVPGTRYYRDPLLQDKNRSR
ncbi:hypothetical protein CCYS_04470 [Corynebacterium cystitidis DSM 20524]|uniref:Uncharacterized protein n=1 Tax=Corynebacterium cystitidis DSM 20524 TaxID=1121357 RepID=A0A1H9WDQ4_9CORY|nr:hypothetical protein CCYS_04470 [Corynebacterium cystitidis DSM 20524]SES31919.1 hypothetical protein SAMN05661109_02682 [Corynebacterium cystitidis DSM 20524]SNV82928.1 H+ Antiporter protein [Corynebacterium cystitidis]